MYIEFFQRKDNRFTYGKFYPVWLPDIEDKMVSLLGDCMVEATNTGAVLSLLRMKHPEWQVIISNWWSIDWRGGHVISGIYDGVIGYSLSNGIFGIDTTTLRGPLFSPSRKYAFVNIYFTDIGYLSIVEDCNPIQYKFDKPFSNMDKIKILELLDEVAKTEKDTYFGYGEQRELKYYQVEELINKIKEDEIIPISLLMPSNNRVDLIRLMSRF